MTREEAIKILMGYSYTPEERTALGTLLPEFRMSEDERIRRKMIEHFKAKTKETWCNMPVKDIISYLEKQEIFSKGEGCYYYADGSYTFIGSMELGPIEDIKLNGERPKTENKGVDLPGACLCVEKQKEQEPAEWDELQTEFRSINEAFEDGKKEVIEHPEKYGLQKPAEWSEDTIRKAVKEAGLTQHQIDWFKNNVFPPKPEWSEEDEAMRDNILRLLSCFVGTLECDSNPSLSTSYPAYQREMDWLKSLRPSWKPSEEQIEALVAATLRYQSTGLESLYEDLKKLKYE